MATTKKQDQENKSFEQSLTRLDEIITLLEKDNVPLDDLMRLYEEGVGLLRHCNESLDKAEQKVKLLRFAPEENKVYLESFEQESEA